MRTEDELNLLIAKWIWPNVQIYIPKMGGGIRVRIEHLTTQYDLFTHSLPELFQVAVPELWNRNLDIELFSDTADSYFAHIHECSKSYQTPVASSVVAEERPAMAIARALEQLIDSEAKEDQTRRTSMRTETELKCLIAEWCGFKPPKCGLPNHMIYPEEFEPCLDIPDFIHSLDALFKWPVPKCNEEGWYFTLKTHTYGLPKGAKETVPGFAVHVLTEANIELDTWDEYNLALALCRAIEKLIDEDVKEKEEPNDK